MIDGTNDMILSIQNTCEKLHYYIILSWPLNEKSIFNDLTVIKNATK